MVPREKVQVYESRQSAGSPACLSEDARSTSERASRSEILQVSSGHCVNKGYSITPFLDRIYILKS